MADGRPELVAPIRAQGESMNGNQISLWRFDPSVNTTAKLFFPRATALSVWNMKHAIKLELHGAKL